MSAAKLYVDLLIRTIANTIYGDRPQDPWSDASYNESIRSEGRDWPSQAHSMVGVKRLENLRMLTERALARGIPGDLIETGVWRGGACILMRGILAAHGVKDRKVVVADSFDGLPPPNPKSFPQDRDDTHHTFRQLAIPLEQVKTNFAAYDLLDAQVEFLKGWFRDTLPGQRGRKWALIRLDGDMYESTLNGLENLYDSLSPGGFIIVDDYGAIAACRQAVDEFRAKHHIDAPMTSVDWTGIWWQKP
ncbi:TylF/MycF family methyltransferase [Xinfangfangia sp. CPCC 101601]|uniref:TylF/MycF family methyltransferase n=1 Tax=Pseudogemmobacter lacusdianii TaxID=3069608 RepID=A0ABU0W1F1_9RHOB|nr:TylF/MycF family methyltransferase [Xinfangfangia sp. CPCC 101601]MDQ2067255.1 TylF/MycF family methyltransferase [Xinfangfangia sp. CPCC 101601]